MGWRRPRIRNPETEHQAGTRAEAVLPGACVNKGARESRHQIIQLREAPSQVLGQHEIDAAAGSQRKRVLRAAANHRLPGVRGTEQKFPERHKIVELAPIQPGTKQVTLHGSVERATSDVAVLEAIPSGLGCQAQRPRSVISEGTRRAVVAKIRGGTGGLEIYVVVHGRELVPGNERAWGTRVGRGGRSREGGWARRGGQHEQALRRHRFTASRGLAGKRTLLRARCGGVRRFAACSAVLLLGAQRQSQERAHREYSTPIAHHIPPELDESNSVWFTRLPGDRPQFPAGSVKRITTLPVVASSSPGTHFSHINVPTQGEKPRKKGRGAVRLFHNSLSTQLLPRSPAAVFHCLLSIFPRIEWLWSAGPTRRLAFNSTSTESGRAFQKSSRMRLSESCVIVAGMALAVRYHPAGRTTALRGRPRLRSKTSSSASKR